MKGRRFRVTAGTTWHKSGARTAEQFVRALGSLTENQKNSYLGLLDKLLGAKLEDCDFSVIKRHMEIQKRFDKEERERLKMKRGGSVAGGGRAVLPIQR